MPHEIHGDPQLSSEFNSILQDMAEAAEDIAHLELASSKARTSRVNQLLMESERRLFAFRRKLRALQKKRSSNSSKVHRPEDKWDWTDLPGHGEKP